MQRNRNRRLAAAVARASSASQPLLESTVLDVGKSCGLDAGRLRIASDGFSNNGKGLYAERDFQPGEVLLAIPMSLCVIAEKDREIRVPGASWTDLVGGGSSASGGIQDSRVGRRYTRLKQAVRNVLDKRILPLPWPIRASLSLLDICGGAGGAFWNEYTSLLPCPDDLAVPVVLDEEQLALAADPALSHETSIRQQKLLQMARASCGEFLPEDDGGGGCGGENEEEICRLLWAAACVRSRSFALSETVFAMAPFIDMVNHSCEMNAEVITQAIDTKTMLYEFASET